MSQEEEFLVSGAELKCSCGTITCILKEGKGCTAIRIRNRLFLPVQATKKRENIEGFGMCLSQKCYGGTIPCTARMLLANKWINPIGLNSILMIQGEEAIHRNAKLICVSGQAFIQALTTGQEKLIESEEKFYKYMEEMFGFDKDIIAIMLKVIYAIDEKYPNETERDKAWMFARLIGGFSYGIGGEDKFIEIREKMSEDPEIPEDNAWKQFTDIVQWTITAGLNLTELIDGERYFVNELNLSPYEYYKLRFHVMAQHEITSRPEITFPEYIKGTVGEHPYTDVWEKFFNDFNEKAGLGNKRDFEDEWERLYRKYVNISDDEYDKLKAENNLFANYGEIEKNFSNTAYILEPNYSDFAHLQILIATITPDVEAENIVEEKDKKSETEERVAGLVNKYRKSLAGWLGDIWLADSKMSEDDYKADLDGVNIANLIIKEDINTIEALNEYYNAIGNGITTREKEFLCNMGDGDASKGLENIKTMDLEMGLASILLGKDTLEEAKKTSEEFVERIEKGLE